MEYRNFGRMGWKVSELGYGMWGIAGCTGSDYQESFDALQKSVDLGCNFFDTAWSYGDGHSEKILARLLAANPGKKLYTATKIPPKNRHWPSRRDFTLDDCFPPDYIDEYVQRSLENLQIPKIDLIQFHVWEDAWVDDTRWLKAMDHLKKQGLIEGVGISLNRWEPWNGVRAVKSGAVDAVQVIYNIFDQNPEDELFPACQENDVAIIARVPFDEGTLTGALTKSTHWPAGDWRNTYFNEENLAASVDRAEALRSLIPPGMTMAEMALRFVLSNSMVSTVIPGMRRETHVLSNIAAANRGPLSQDLIAELREHRWDRIPTEWSQ